MNIMKKISAFLLTFVLFASCIPMVAHAAGGSITFTDPETAVGEKVEIKCVVRSDGESLGNIEIGLSYDSQALRFDSGDGVTSAGDGALTCQSSGGSSEVSFVMTFQALTEGSSKITISSLSAVTESGAALNPEQGDSTVKTGPGDPSKIEQTTATSADDMQVEVNGVAYTLTDNFASADIPAGYSRTTVPLGGTDHSMVVNEAGTIYLAYLVDGEGHGEFFIYNQDDATFWPYEEIFISDSTSIVVLSDTSKVKLPKSYQEAKLTLNDKEFPVWQDNAHDGYYIIYAMNNNGETGYYQYDEAEGTYQKVELSGDTTEEETTDNSFMGKIRSFLDKHLSMLVLIMGLGGIVILVLIIVLAVKLRNRNLELDDLYDEYGIDLEDEEPAIQKSSAKQGKKEGKRRKLEEDEFEALDMESFDEDDFDEDDFDEDDFDEDDFDEDDFGEDDFDDDIFSDEKLGKYDTVNIRREAPVGGVGTEDDLDELLGTVTKSKKTVSSGKKEDFTMDFIDLD